MKQLNGLLLLVVLLQTEICRVFGERTFFPNTQITGDNNDQINKTSRIVGGEVASISDFPFQVRIIRYDQGQTFQCGGSIISKTKIITAAHCVVDKTNKIAYPKNIEIKGGSALISSEAMKKFTVQKILVHPQFNRSNLNNDVAVLIVDKPIKFDKNISSIKMTSTPPKENETCVISGWGKTDPKDKWTSHFLSYTNVTIIKRNRCIKLLNAYHKKQKLISSMICAQRLDKLGDICQGDSGGPLVCGNLLKGIASSRYCGIPTLPGIYTSVASYGDWLKDKKFQKTSGSKTKYCFMSMYYFIVIVVFFFQLN